MAASGQEETVQANMKSIGKQCVLQVGCGNIDDISQNKTLGIDCASVKA